MGEQGGNSDSKTSAAALNSTARKTAKRKQHSENSTAKTAQRQTAQRQTAQRQRQDTQEGDRARRNRVRRFVLQSAKVDVSLYRVVHGELEHARSRSSRRGSGARRHRSRRAWWKGKLLRWHVGEVARVPAEAASLKVLIADSSTFATFPFGGRPPSWGRGRRYRRQLRPSRRRHGRGDGLRGPG